jgi:hypothetical protein
VAAHEVPGFLWHDEHSGSCWSLGMVWLFGVEWQLSQEPASAECLNTKRVPGW